ncbi:Site-2 protease family protein [Burkholderiales bacterium 8X]|nr:Site-2 protease family protein [Burkholderiales bacterium 8X]
MDIQDLIQTVLIYALPVIFAITVHEASHGYVARYLGDNTAYVLGRVTLNPIRHIDPIGTIVMPLVLYIATSGTFLFGYAKPVPVNFGHLRNPKRDMIWVALAGPASNFIQAILWAAFFYLLKGMNVEEPFFLRMAQGGVLVNLVMWAFNLFPLPPLDGGRVLAGVLPRGRAQDFLSRIEPYGFFIVMGLVLAGIITNWWMRPLMGFGYDAISFLLTPVTALLR